MPIENKINTIYYTRIRYIHHGYKERKIYGRNKSKKVENLPLTPAVFNILLALIDGEKHGYAIMQEVDVNTNHEVKMGPGTLYGSIKRMLEAGLIEEVSDRPDPEMDDQRHRYYRITGQGNRALKLEAERLTRQVRIVRLKKVLEFSF